ncbi:inner nuclear membrane protein enriched at telomere/subtelomere region [Cryomyces antarcticus]|uniref:Inner nuclear membrane protein enriched at telomere/subtelomere region n=1 Tax=Cryomyces antarcticus TaxID=329879 RepID=A0ABR0LST8_9PEZI|nr:inner nuclear membrane protein enriched at telomere/subtelomere region [Cryomyces antarcticus]
MSDKRRKGMSQEEFEDLWKGAIPEITGREEITSAVDGLVAAATEPVVTELSVPTPKPAFHSTAPSDDPSDSRWRDIFGSL